MKKLQLGILEKIFQIIFYSKFVRISSLKFCKLKQKPIFTTLAPKKLICIFHIEKNNTVKLGYNKFGYNELSVITNKKK